jgi:hypothetical protein
MVSKLELWVLVYPQDISPFRVEVDPDKDVEYLRRVVYDEGKCTTLRNFTAKDGRFVVRQSKQLLPITDSSSKLKAPPVIAEVETYILPSSSVELSRIADEMTPPTEVVSHLFSKPPGGRLHVVVQTRSDNQSNPNFLSAVAELRPRAVPGKPPRNS